MLRSPLRPPLRSPLYQATAPRASSSLTAQVRAIYAVSGRVGVMFDTQDLSTMYTTRAGSTLIGTPGNGTAQFVGRWEDKSLGRVLGPELVTNGDGNSAAGWTATNGSVSSSGGTLVFTKSAIIGSGLLVAAISTTVGRSYMLAADHVTNSGGFQMYVGASNNSDGTSAFATGPSVSVGGRSRILFVATATTTYVSTRVDSMMSLGTYSADNISTVELPGRHALAPNDTTGRPQLSARVNLLTYTEDFSNANWSKANVTLTTGQTDVFGGTKATKVEATATTNTSLNQITVGGGATSGNTSLFYAKQGSGATDMNTFIFRDNTAATNIVAFTFNYSTGAIAYTTGSSGVTATDAGGGWWLIVIVANAVANGNNVRLYLGSSGASETAGEFAYFCFPDLRPTNIHAAGSIPPYQRVVDAETYDSAGFPFRFIPNGTGQAFQTSTITPGSDTVTVVAGVRKTSDAALQIVAEHTASLAANNGAWYLSAPNAASASIAFSSKGTAAAAAVTASLTAPLTRVLTGTGKISTDTCALALNGAASSTDATDQGTGDYAAAVTNLFARGGASNWFGGQAFRYAEIYGTLTPAETATLEAWVNESTKAY